MDKKQLSKLIRYMFNEFNLRNHKTYIDGKMAFKMWMKLLITFLLLLSSIGQAQITSEYGIKFGMVSSRQILEKGSEATRNLLWESYRDRNWSRRLGPQIGLFAQFLNARYLTLLSEVSCLQKGTDEKIYPTLVDSDGNYIAGESVTIETFQFDYIAVSILVQPRIPSNQIEPYILAGPSLNILIANKELLFEDADLMTTSVVIGGGFEFRKLFEFPLLIEIRYNPDLKYFFKNKYVKSRFQTWQFILGVKLNR